MAKYTIGAVVYQGAWDFLQDFFESIANQKGLEGVDYELLVLNDNCNIDELNKLIFSIIPQELCKILDYSLRDYKMTPALFRMELLKQAKQNGTELLIVGDTDDVMTDTRVSSLVMAFENAENADCSYFYNDLILRDGKKIFTELPKVTNKDNIMNMLSQQGYVGMGTCAIVMRKLSETYIESLCDADVTAYDWYLGTRLVMDIGPAAYVADAAMIYRIYDQNAAGVIIEYNQKNLSRELNFKKLHYEFLGRRYKAFKALSIKFNELYELGGDSLEFWEQYRNPKVNGCWWNLVRI